MALLEVRNHINHLPTSLHLWTDLNRDCPITPAGKTHPLLENQLTSIHIGDTRPAEDVVATHRRRNRASCLPETLQLNVIRQRQSSFTPWSLKVTNTNNIPNVQEGPELMASAVSLHPHVGDRREVSNQLTQLRATVERTEHAEPWQIQFYEPAVRDILERAKQFSRCNASSINVFPLHVQFNVKAAEYVEEAISERRSQGLFVADGTVLCTKYSS